MPGVRLNARTTRHGITYDHEEQKMSLFKLEREGHDFEIVVDPDQAEKFRKGETDDLDSVLMDRRIFTDARDGTLAPEHMFEQYFGTDDESEIARVILKEGLLHLRHTVKSKHLFK